MTEYATAITFQGQLRVPESGDAAAGIGIASGSLTRKHAKRRAETCGYTERC